MVSTSYDLSCEEPEAAIAESILSEEMEALDRLVQRAREGKGQALVVLGDAGSGKTTLIEHALASAPDLRIVRIRGIESERDLVHAALQRLCSPMLDKVDGLPGPRRDALVAALGVRPGTVSVLFVGLAVIDLLTQFSENQPLVCVIDDAQWLDQPSMQVLAFVARRVPPLWITLLFSARTPIRELEELPELIIRRLSHAEAHAFVTSAFPGPLHARVQDRIVAESRGNLGALSAFADGLSPEGRAGGFGLPPSVRRTDARTETLREQLEALPWATRRLLLIAASEPEGDLALFWRVVARLGIDPGAADEAASLGLLEFGIRVIFRDPKMRSVVYHGAPFGERRRVHRAVADMSDGEVAPARRAWHLSHATLGTDGEIADTLEHSVGDAQSRGGLPAAAAFLERSALLTPEPALRAKRALAAAHAKYETGAFEAASQLLSMAAEGGLDQFRQAQLERLRTNVAFAHRRGAAAPGRLLESARTLERFHVEHARETYLQAFEAVLGAGRFGVGPGVADVASASRAAPPAIAPSASDLLLDGLAIMFTDGYTAAAPTLKQAVRAACRKDETRWLGLACRTAAELWDADAVLNLATSWIRVHRDVGALAELPMALDHLAVVQVQAGEFAPAARLIEDADAMSEMMGRGQIGFGALVLAAWRGSEKQAAELIEAHRADARDRGDGRQIVHSEYAAAVLYNGLGRYREAFAFVQPACDRDELHLSWVLPELIEAASRSGEAEVASAAAEQLKQRTQVSGTELALGIQSRSLALVTDGTVAEQLYKNAIVRLGGVRDSVHRARAHLLYGEWLRRQRRRVDAREQLRIADGLFSAMGAGAFAARAHRELMATGERARRRSVETGRDLTPQEAEIARLARGGSSNPQIGAKLFISARTVEYHLHKVFTKLAISSRNQLEFALEPEIAGPSGA
jgi:DNA-binding CsgD family transcriptional regulator/tetratricopeptide (TPR) repeat protein